MADDREFLAPIIISDAGARYFFRLLPGEMPASARCEMAFGPYRSRLRTRLYVASRH